MILNPCSPSIFDSRSPMLRARAGALIPTHAIIATAAIIPSLRISSPLKPMVNPLPGSKPPAPRAGTDCRIATRLHANTNLAEMPAAGQVIQSRRRLFELKHAVDHRTHPIAFDCAVHVLEHLARTD